MAEGARLHPSQGPGGGEDRAEGAPTVAPRAAGVRVFADGELVCERFRIVRYIGGGGMGQVYEAQDLELGEPVALKAIRPEFAWNEEAVARFRREIQLSHRITHPNVCRVFDIAHHRTGAGSGIPLLTMELLSGETLERRLFRAGRMSTAEALPIARQMAEGLRAAHRAGVLHRDFKSNNVILVPDAGDGLRAVVTDFGLARSFTDTDRRLLTGAGQVLGTLAYMAPEQFAGGESTIATDIYALGVVLYEMVTGARPFEQTTPLQRLFEAPPSPRLRVPELDPHWESALQRCLDPDPDRRFRTATDVIRAAEGEPLLEGPSVLVPIPPPLWIRISRRWMLLGPAAALLLAGALWQGGLLRWSQLPAQKRLAVLPLTSLGGNAADKAFCEGVAETLTSKLSQLERLQESFWVVPASEARSVKDAREAHRTLGVTLVVDGSFQRIGDGARLAVNLIDAAARRVLDSRSIEASAAELFSLQDRVWERVADMLDLQLSSEARRALAAGDTRVPGAYAFYEQARGYVLRYGLENTDRAISLFQQAIAQDPTFAAAYAGLGDAYSRKFTLTKDPQFIELCRKYGTRALELNPRLAPVRLTLGQMYYTTGQWAEAVEAFKGALEIDRSSADAYYRLGRTYQALGRFQDAETAFKTVISLRPGYATSYSGLGTLYYRLGRHKEAESQFQTVIALAPDNLRAYHSLSGVYIAQGRYDAVEAVARRSLQIRPEAAAYHNLAAAYMFQGRYREAVPLMEEAVKLEPKRHNRWRNLGDACRGTPGLEARAREAYETAVRLASDLVAINPKDADTLADLAVCSAKLDRKQDARAYASKASRHAPTDNDVLLKCAETHELVGERARALELIERMLRAGFPPERIQKEPELERLRTDPRFLKLLKAR